MARTDCYVKVSYSVTDFDLLPAWLTPLGSAISKKLSAEAAAGPRRKTLIIECAR